MKNKYMERRGSRQTAFMEMINEYEREHGIHYFLVVEGDSDEKFFKKFLDCEKCKVSKIGEGGNDRENNKKKVLEFIKKQNERRKKCYLGIIDADFDHILQKEETTENIITTDYHDMEMVILNSQPDISSLYAEIADTRLIKEFENNSGQFIESVMNVAYEIGILRLACIKRPERSRPSTKDLKFQSSIRKDFSINMHELVTRVVKGSDGKCQFEQDLEEWMNFEKQQNHDKYQVCCGHDVTAILVQCFSDDEDSLGYGCTPLLNSSRIESLLRVAYRSDSFQQTKMYTKILEWQKKNSVTILDEKVFTQ